MLVVSQAVLQGLLVPCESVRIEERMLGGSVALGPTTLFADRL